MSGAMRTAVVLGAGLGARLRPVTDDRPKCAVTLAGEPLAARMIRQLAARGVRHAVVVVGHMAARARELVAGALPAVRGLELSFVENADYATTNTMYSTLLAIDALADGGYLIEGDIAASEEAIDRLTAAGPSVWACEAWTPAHSGSQLRADARGRIVGQAIVREPVACAAWKSAGMLALAPTAAAALGRALRAEADAGHTRIYYDDVVGRHLDELPIDVLDLGGAPWVEIDDLDDLARARALFEGPSR